MDKHLFLGANTPDGFVHYFDKVVDMYDLKKLYILKGGSGVGKSTFIKNFVQPFCAEHDITYFYCSGDPKSLDGAVIESLGVGILDGTSPHVVDPKWPGVIDETVNLGEFIIWENVKATKDKIDEITTKKKALYAEAYKALKKSRELHHELEALYKDAVDFNSVNALCNKLINKTRLEAGAIRRNSPLTNSTK